MALQPSLSPLIIGNVAAPHTLEFYLDFVCPYSRKSYRTTYDFLRPLVTSGDLANKVKIIIRLIPQPWHIASPYTHEAALAFIRVSPEQTLDYLLILMDNQEQFFNIRASTITPADTRIKLAELATPLVGAEKVAVIKDLLTHKTTPNGGVDVTDSLKYNVKISRHNSIHVSPTVLFDGLIAPDVSSSWDAAKWTDFFKANVTI